MRRRLNNPCLSSRTQIRPNLESRFRRNLTSQNRFEHFTIYTNGYRHLHPADIIPLRDCRMLLTAREATEHVARDGDIVVLRSEDGRKWTKTARFGVPNLDEREACGIVLPDGSILLTVFYNALYREEDEYEQKWKSTVKIRSGKTVSRLLHCYVQRSRCDMERTAIHLDEGYAVF